MPQLWGKIFNRQGIKAMDRLLPEDNKVDHIDFEPGPLEQSLEEPFRTLPQAAILFKDQSNGYTSFIDLFPAKEIIAEWKRKRVAS